MLARAHGYQIPGRSTRKVAWAPRQRAVATTAACHGHHWSRTRALRSRQACRCLSLNPTSQPSGSLLQLLHLLQAPATLAVTGVDPKPYTLDPAPQPSGRLLQLLHLLKAPALGGGRAVEVDDELVELAQRRAVPNGQHGDARAHARPVEHHLPVRADLWRQAIGLRMMPMRMHARYSTTSPSALTCGVRR